MINGEKFVTGGPPVNTVAYEMHRRTRKGHPMRSTTRPRLADRFVRRAIRGMLPWKKARGKEAYKRIMCHVGVPTELASVKAVVLAKQGSQKLPTLKHTTVGAVCKALRGQA